MSIDSPLDPVLFGALTAAVEEESALAYEAGFSDGLRAARFRLPPDEEELDDGLASGHLLLP
jgi:hypothetical protein